MHYRNPPAVQCRSALTHTHPTLVETNPQTERTVAAAPIWPWLPLGQGVPPKADPMVWELEESPASVSNASMTPEYVYDWSVKAVAELPALPPQHALPAVHLLSALPTMSAA